MNRRKAWSIRETFPVWSGAVATAGDLAFYGTMDRYFKAAHARSGQPLWSFRTSSGIIGQPITYKLSNGKHYVAILAGVGGWAGAVVSGPLDPKDPTAGARLRGRHEGSPRAYAARRNALRVRVAVAVSTARSFTACVPSARLPQPARRTSMETTTRSVVGVFEDYSSAMRVREQLIASGFQQSEIDVQSRDSYAEDAARGNTGLTGHTHDSSGGGIGGFFRRLFGDDDTTYNRQYSQAVDHGHSVVCVTTSDERRQDLAADIMERAGAIDVDERSSSWGGDARHLHGRHGDATDRTIPVVHEDLEVGKRMVQRGGVRIVNRVIEQPVEEQVNLREEHVRVDRRPVNRPATERDFELQDEVVEVTEMAEEPVVGKRTRVVEEVGVRKEATERTETVRDTVRRTDVDVQNLGSRYDDDFRTHFKSRYGSSGASYDTYAPAYDYGYRMASDERYRGRRWEDVERDLRSDYERRYPGSTWDRMKDSIRYGWDRVTR